MGRQHSVTNGCFQETKPQRPLTGDELELLVVATRPIAVIQVLRSLGLLPGHKPPTLFAILTPVLR